MAGHHRRRLLAFLLVAAAVGSGIVWFLTGGAPGSYAAVNGAALLFVAVALAVPDTRPGRWWSALVPYAGAALLLATVAIGPGVDGVHRWIAIGPVRLHAGVIVLPAMLAVLSAGRTGTVPAAAAILALIFWLQPDSASAMALVGGIAGLVMSQRSDRPAWLALGIATAGLAATLMRPDPLEPVAFVETALGDAWRALPLLGATMAMSLAAAILLAPWLVERRPLAQPRASWAVSGCLAGYAASALILDHPQPLIGYGASPILGMALALWMVRARADSTA